MTPSASCHDGFSQQRMCPGAHLVLCLATILPGGRSDGQEDRPWRKRARIAGSPRRLRPTVSGRPPPTLRSASAAIAANSGRSTGRRPRTARIRRARGRSGAFGASRGRSRRAYGRISIGPSACLGGAGQRADDTERKGRSTICCESRPVIAVETASTSTCFLNC